MDQSDPLPPPEVSCGLRWDFAIEMGLLDVVRATLVELMNAARASTPVPRWSVACSAWSRGASTPAWYLTNGDEWLRVKNEGLWQDMLDRMIAAGLPMARVVAPRVSTEPDRAVFGDRALLHDANVGRLMAYPSAQVRGWVRHHQWDRIRH